MEVDLSHNQIESLVISKKYDFFKELDLSHNNLKEISGLRKLPSLVFLKLSHNPSLSFDTTELNYMDCIKYLDINKTEIKLSPTVNIESFDEIILSEPNIISPIIKSFADKNVGYSEMIGSRDNMEDSLIIKQNSDFDLYAVIDGHAGRLTSSLTAFKLPQLITEFSIQNIISGIKSLVLFLQKEDVQDGATLALIAKKGNKIICLNIGDSRALIVRKDGSAFHLSYDHKPYERSELERIRDESGFVIDDRTCGILAISRAIGDFSIKGVSSIPYICEYELNEFDSKIVLACDGVFDVLSVDEVGKIVQSESDPSIASHKLRNNAFAKQSQDNISVIVVNI